MSEPHNDRLEQFVRKAVSQPDVTFNEAHWKKLEARLDTHDALTAAAGRPGKRLATVAVTSAIVLFIASTILISFYTSDPNTELRGVNTPVGKEEGLVADEHGHNSASGRKSEIPVPATSQVNQSTMASGGGLTERSDTPVSNAGQVSKPGAAISGDYVVVEIGSDRIARDLMTTSGLAAERNKQKAKVKLPGAEEVKTGDAESVVNEEDVSDQVDHVASPRLSLLLSFAPDFSGTSLGNYTAPGKAFGVMLHYHVSKRWSVAAGVIRNNKQYSGDGEDYRPPAGYWKYYTNGKIPARVNGACDVLEFPMMVQYNLLHSNRHKLLAAAGTSSYLMQRESYQYSFDEPNPGAREGWKARKSSRFLFNMVNVSLGYERQLLPGLALGVEPYVKIPIEDIGWCNLRLFSTGVSVTMRYTLLRKNTFSVTSRSRGPD